LLFKTTWNQILFFKNNIEGVLMNLYKFLIFTLLIFSFGYGEFIFRAFCDSMGCEFPKYRDSFSMQKWSLFKDMHDRLIAHKFDSEVYKIPKKIHFVWIGGKLPEKYKFCIESWKRHHQDWEIKLWTDDDIESFQLHNKEAFNLAKNYGQKSDIYKYEIVERYGGVYIDIDFYCCKSLDELVKNFEFFSALISNGTTVGAAFIACTPHHYIMNRCINNIEKIEARDFNQVLKVSGPEFFTHIIYTSLCNMKDISRVALFPLSYFYSFPAVKRYDFWRGDILLKDILSSTPDEAYGVHLWATSWQKK
jgi:inositol phosphorylceramide mannosyltransferase catalytic subunit